MTGNDSLSLHVPGLKPRTEPADLSKAQIPHANPFLCDIDIQQEHMSRAVDHVSNVEYVRWFDRAAELHADSLSYTRQRMLEDGLMWFVARHEIDYLAEVWSNDKLILATWVRDMTRVRSWRDYVIIRPVDSTAESTIVCRGSTLWVLIDLEKRKPVKISADMVNRFQPLHLEATRRGRTMSSET